MKIEINLSRFKQQFEENPVLVIGIVGAAAGGLAKLMNANTARKNSNTWKTEVNRRSAKK